MLRNDCCPKCEDKAVISTIMLDGCVNPHIGKINYLNVCLRCGTVFLPEYLRVKAWNKKIKATKESKIL